MNKMLKSDIRCLYIIAFGFLSILITRICKYELASNILIGIMIGLVLLEVIHKAIYISKFKKRYINNELNKEDNITKINQYKKNKKIMNINDLIITPIFTLDVLILCTFFKNQIFDEGEKTLIYIVFISIIAFMIKMIGERIKRLKILNTIDEDIKDKNIETIKGNPTDIRPLYHGYTSYKDDLKIGCGLELLYGNDLKLIVLMDYPNIGRRKMKKLIEENLMDKKFELKYLKSSGLVVEVDSKIVNALR